MNPETQQPSYTPYPGNTPQPIAPQGTPGGQGDSKKRLVIIGIVILLVLAIGSIVFWLFASGKKSNDNTGKNNDSSPAYTAQPVTIGTAPQPVTYMGNQMYDACNFIPLDLMKKHVGEYERSFNSLGGSKTLKEPLGIEHEYFDRNLSTILGEDGTPRGPSVAVSETGVDTSVRLQSFASIGESNCLYGQNNFKTRLLQVIVSQPPKPLHPKLLERFAELKAKGLMPGTEQGVEIYIEEVKEGDDTLFTALRKGNVVVFLSTRNRPLMEALLIPSIQRLNQAPTGNMTTTYPQPYTKLTNVCDLLPADDFERLMGKPADAQVGETLTVTESEPNTAKRECRRVEVQRLKEGEISSVSLELTESRTEKQTKDRLGTIKADKYNKLKDLNNLGDEAYAVTNTIIGDRYSILVRSGKVLIKIESNGETKDKNVDAFLSRTLPVAQKVLENYKK